MTESDQMSATLKSARVTHELSSAFKFRKKRPATFVGMWIQTTLRAAVHLLIPDFVLGNGDCVPVADRVAKV